MFFEGGRLVDFHGPEAPGVEDDHREAGAVDEIILPTEAPAFLIDAEGVAEHDDIVVFVVVLEVVGDLKKILVEDGLGHPVAKLILGISSQSGQVAVHGLQPRSEAPDHSEDRHKGGSKNFTVKIEAHLKILVEEGAHFAEIKHTPNEKQKRAGKPEE